MGSGWVQLSPRQEVSNFKKLWLLAEVLGSFKPGLGREGPQGRGAPSRGICDAWGYQRQFPSGSSRQAQAPLLHQGLFSLLLREYFPST